MAEREPRAARILVVTVAIYAAARAGLFALAWVGDAAALPFARAHFTPETIAAGQDYARDRIVAAAVVLALEVALLLAALLLPLARRVAAPLVALGQRRPALAAALFYLGLSAAELVVTLPAQVALTWRAEVAHGFLSQSWPAFAGYFALDFAISSLGEAALLFVLFALWLRGRAWLLALGPVCVALLSAASWALFPVVIAPFFGTYRPVHEANLQARIDDVIARAGVPVERVRLLEAGHYDRHANATLMGVGPARTLVLYDTLLVHFDYDEIATMIAHELGHAKARDHLVGLALLALEALLGGALFVAFARRAARDPALDLASARDPRLVALGLVALMWVSLPFAPLRSAVRRAQERRADAFSLQVTGARDAFLSTEKKLARLNRERLDPHPWTVAFFATHPPPLARIAWAKARGP